MDSTQELIYRKQQAEALVNSLSERSQSDLIKVAEGEVEQGEGQAQERGRGTEVAVEFALEGKGLTVDGGTGHVEPPVQQADGLVVVEAAEGFGDVEAEGAAGDDGREGEGAERGGGEEGAAAGAEAEARLAGG